MVSAAALALAAACGGSSSEEDAPLTCDDISCGAHGSCIMWEEAPACICEKGYSGYRCGDCAPGFDPAEGGLCVIRCEEGQQDNDGDGVCADDCAHSGLECGPGAQCSDASGQAECVCAEGYQDNDEDGTCQPACASDSCGEHASCDDTSGTIQCACDTGYQDNDGDGLCAPDCTTAALDCAASDPHSECTDVSGTALCGCIQGFVPYQGTCTDKRELTTWTLMVYLDGDNNLSDFAADDLEEMLALTDKDHVNLIVLYDQDRKKDTKLYSISGGAKTELDLEGASIVDNGEASMDDWQTLKRFGVWAAENYPAQRYGLFMWDHGGGWKDNGAGCCRRLNGFRDFATDDHSSGNGYDGIMLSNGDYGKALAAIVQAAGQKLDLVGFDTCLMGMYEVAAATQDYADYLVASEESEPGEGWPWDVFLKKLSANPDMGPVDLGKAIVSAYHDKDETNATLSLTNLSTMDALHTHLDTFAVQLTSAIGTSAGKTAISNIRSNVQEFDYSEHIDLMHFAKLVSSSSATAVSADLKSAAAALVTQLGKTIIFNKTNNYDYYWTTYNYSNAYGMAIFFPEDFYGDYSRTDLTSYGKAPWASKTGWDEFLKKYLE